MNDKDLDRLNKVKEIRKFRKSYAADLIPSTVYYVDFVNKSLVLQEDVTTEHELAYSKIWHLSSYVTGRNF